MPNYNLAVNTTTSGWRRIVLATQPSQQTQKKAVQYALVLVLSNQNLAIDIQFISCTMVLYLIKFHAPLNM